MTTPDLELLQVQQVAIRTLRNDPNNVRVHPARQIAALVASLQQYGQVKPVVATADGTVIAGNGTLMAARQLGWQHLAVVTVPFVDEAAIRAFAIADNRSAEMSEWDIDALVDALGTMEPEWLELSGFTTDDLDDLLDLKEHPIETTKVPISELRPHPRNYQSHPDAQLQHIKHSIEVHGFYRNVVVARDGTILAGHGVVEAATALGITRVPVIRLDIDADEPRALMVLTSDNEISNLAEVDDRALTELLREIMSSADASLIGTGFTEDELAALVYVTRPAGEIADKAVAAEWVGMPDFDTPDQEPRVLIRCATHEDRERLIELIGVANIYKASQLVWSTNWPPRADHDYASVRFTTEAQ